MDDSFGENSRHNQRQYNQWNWGRFKTTVVSLMDQTRRERSTENMEALIMDVGEDKSRPGTAAVGNSDQQAADFSWGGGQRQKYKNMATEEDLCIGDIIYLCSEETRGFAFSFQSSTAHNEIGCAQGQQKLECPQAILFQICAQNRYKANKRFPKIKVKVESDPFNMTLRQQLSQSKKAAQAETTDNELEQNRQLGKPLYYGQVIQLKHKFTGKYIHVNTTQTSWTESSNLLAELLPENSKKAQFKLLPRYKVKSEGDLVQIGDLIILESVKSPGQYLHCSKSLFSDTVVYHDSYEINLSVIASGFSIYRYGTVASEKNYKIQGGSIIQFFHKEMEGYMTAEGMFPDFVTENVHLRIRPVNSTNHKSLTSPTSAITCWTIEKEKNPLDGSTINWEEPVRFQHLTTRQYLIIDSDLKVSLTPNRDNGLTVFKLHPVAKRGHDVEHKSFLRIQHVLTKFWLHGERNKNYDRMEQRNFDRSVRGLKSMQRLSWSKKPVKQLDGYEKMMYDDAYTIILQPKDSVATFNYVAGMVPFLQKLLSEFHHCEDFSARHMMRVVSALGELKMFMKQNGVPVKQFQKLLRDFKVVDILVDLIRCPAQSGQTQDFVRTVHRECYAILRTYLEGFSAKNELYLAKHFEFIQQQLGNDETGLNAAHMLMELLRNNRSIIDLVAPEQIDMFIGLIAKKKNYRYLELLSVLCIANDVTLSENQAYIAEKWLDDTASKHDMLDFLAMGQDIGLHDDVIYVSVDSKKHWVSLKEFVEKKHGHTQEEYLFLVYQLRLFSALCRGRNDVSIHLIAEKCRFMTFEIAFHILRNESLPDELRAVCCANIRDMFVDIGSNYSIMDRVKLVFLYNEIDSPNQPNQGRQRQESVLSGCVPLPFVKQLKTWISWLFETNKSMVGSKSEIARNNLLEQALRLVYSLVSFGYYGDTEDIQKLLLPMLKLMDGRNDLPERYPHKDDTALPPQVQAEIEKFRSGKRFRVSPENTAVTDAKFQAMKVVDLFFNFRFNTRLSRFIAKFKHAVESNSSEFTPFMDKDVDCRHDPSLNKIAERVLNEIFKDSTAIIGTEFVEILHDLLNYQQEKIVTQSLMLMNRYYTAHENLFRKCIDTQLLITEKCCMMHSKVTKHLPQLKLLKKSKWNAETVERIVEILKDCTRMCSLENDVRENHPMNQEILYNYGVLQDVFDLLSHYARKPEDELSNKKKSAESKTQAELLKYIFRFLKALARNNPPVQQRIFDRLEFLTGIRGADAELGETLIEIFSKSLGNCMKIEQRFIQEFARLYSETFHPVWLSVLTSLVVVEIVPIKRNQNHVIKALMTHNSSLSIITDTDSPIKMMILKEEEQPGKHTYDQKHRLCTLVHLISICAMSENKSIESICQCLLVVDELLGFINMQGLCDGLRLPFLNFLTTGYLHSYSTEARNEIATYGADERMTAFLKGTATTLERAMKLIQEDVGVASEILRQRPANLHRSTSDVVHEKKETLHYIFDGILPMLYAVFEKHWGSAIPANMELANDILSSLLKFAQASHPAISRAYQRSLLQKTLRLISHTTGLPVSVPVELNIRVDVPSESRQTYNLYYSDEQKLNDKFDTFAGSMLAAYEGPNTVRHQLKIPIDFEYCNPFEDVLPLGEEFQDFVKCFMLKLTKKDSRKYDITGLVKHLSWSLTLTDNSEQNRLELERLDLKCLQILRAMIHNVLVKLPANKQENPEQFAKVLKEIQAHQQALDSQGLAQAVMPHLSRPNKTIVREVFNLLHILYRGNKKTPETFVRYINLQHEESFFVAVQHRMNNTASLIKEQRFMVSLYQRNAKETETLMKASGLRASKTRTSHTRRSNTPSKSFLKDGMGKSVGGVNQMKNLFISRVSPDEDMELKTLHGNRDGTMTRIHSATGDGIPLIVTEVDEDMDLHAARNDLPTSPDTIVTISAVDMERKKTGGDKSRSVSAELKEEAAEEQNALYQPDLFVFHDLADVRVVLRTLQSLCDLEFSRAQNLIREQPDNVKSVNLVQEVGGFLSLVYTNIDSGFIDLVSDLLETIIEFVQGNGENQAVVFDNKVIDYLNHMLRAEDYSDCIVDDVLRLKKAIGTVIRFMTEENQIRSTKSSGRGTNCQSKVIMTAVNVDGVWQTALDLNRQATDESLTLEQRQDSQEIAFVYFGLVRRALDLGLYSPDDIKDQSLWQFFQIRTMTLEFVKNDVLQRLCFRVTDQKALRTEVEEKMKWEVDRSSYGNKMRDFMAWIKDIHDDILFQRRINGNFLGRFLVRKWKMFNFVNLILTLSLNMIMIILWKEDVQREGSQDYWLYHHEKYDIPWRVFGSLHNVCSLCLVVSYFLSNGAGFQSSKKTYLRRIKKLNRLLMPATIDPNERPSKLETSILGVHSIYYVLFLVFSILGTVISPSFFSMHLLQIVENNQLLTRVIRAVTLNGRSLLWVAFLGLLIIYIYALVGFIAIRNVYQGNLHFCATLWECTLSTMREGLIYRLMRIDYPIKRQWGQHAAGDPAALNDNENFTTYGIKLIFDISFFVIILTIGLNVIFGIIVDTFRQLRDAKWRTEQDQESRCFICGRNSYEFEQKGISFRYHCTIEHNMLSYVFFFVRLQDMPVEDMSHLEMFVNKMVMTENYNFFPLNRAMSLDDFEDGGSAERDMSMMKQLDSISQQLLEEQVKRAKEAERLRVLEWERANRHKHNMAAVRKISTPQYPAALFDFGSAHGEGSSASERGDDSPYAQGTDEFGMHRSPRKRHTGPLKTKIYKK